jgi:hypothetical protein
MQSMHGLCLLREVEGEQQVEAGRDQGQCSFPCIRLELDPWNPNISDSHLQSTFALVPTTDRWPSLFLMLPA